MCGRRLNHARARSHCGSNSRSQRKTGDIACARCLVCPVLVLVSIGRSIVLVIPVVRLSAVASRSQAMASSAASSAAHSTATFGGAATTSEAGSAVSVDITLAAAATPPSPVGAVPKAAPPPPPQPQVYGAIRAHSAGAPARRPPAPLDPRQGTRVSPGAGPGPVVLMPTKASVGPTATTTMGPNGGNGSDEGKEGEGLPSVRQPTSEGGGGGTPPFSQEGVKGGEGLSTVCQPTSDGGNGGTPSFPKDSAPKVPGSVPGHGQPASRVAVAGPAQALRPDGHRGRRKAPCASGPGGPESVIFSRLDPAGSTEGNAARGAGRPRPNSCRWCPKRRDETSQNVPAEAIPSNRVDFPWTRGYFLTGFVLDAGADLRPCRQPHIRRQSGQN